MKQTLIIRIPEPCDEQWSNMEITSNGRTCARCERKLIDFTRFSNRELADYVTVHEGKLCGKFAPHQLDRNLLQHAASYSGLSLPALAIMAATLTANPAQAQISETPEIVATRAQEDSLKQGGLVYRTISGVVKVDGEELLPGAIVELRDKDSVVQRVTSDIDGRFTFRIHSAATYDSIHVDAPGIFEKTIAVQTLGDNDALVLHLQSDITVESVWLGIVYIDKKQLRKNRRAARKEDRRND